MKDLNKEYKEYHNGAEKALGIGLILIAIFFIVIGITIGLTMIFT